MLPALLPALALEAVCSFLKKMSSIEISHFRSRLGRLFFPQLLTPLSHFFSTSPLLSPFLLSLTPQNNRHRPENALFPPYSATFLPLWHSHF